MKKVYGCTSSCTYTRKESVTESLNDTLPYRTGTQQHYLYQKDQLDHPRKHRHPY